MSNEVASLIEIIKKSKVPIAKIARDLDIPAQRIYGWTLKNATPKYEDVQKIKEYFGIIQNKITEKEKSFAYDSLFSVIITELAALKAERTGEPIQSIVRKIYKAAQDELVREK